MMAWYVPDTNLKYGKDSEETDEEECTIRTASARIRFINHGIPRNSAELKMW